MQGNAKPESRGRASPDRKSVACGLDIGGQNGEEKNEKAKPGKGASARNQKSDGAEDFANACEIDQAHRIGKDCGHHAGEVVAHFGEVSAAGKEKHHCEREARGVNPGRENGNSQSP